MGFLAYNASPFMQPATHNRSRHLEEKRWKLTLKSSVSAKGCSSNQVHTTEDAFTKESEIRNTDYYNGNFYCGNDIEPGTRMTSQGGNFIIIISADDEMEGKGLRAKIRFV
ncbi:CUB domain-containing protein [Caerostris extrusa]|uniref:CUB domain-containing protein n=1 Tax=Caerostris extrusa TaxID=172846 RepID=A0AAV4XTF7_CAEEX|nr:CUB domain-containing protein [Caerostris extrusa]